MVMMDRRQQHAVTPVPGIFYGLAGAAAAAFIVSVAAFTANPRPASALPAYAQQTGLSCGRCHVNPAGGGPRNAFGNAFAANGHKLPSSAKSGKTAETKPGASKPEKSKVAAAPAAPAAPTPAPGVVLDHAQAHAISLRPPYYSLFQYDSCDYSDCGAQP
jgi:hypothetical protein